MLGKNLALSHLGHLDATPSDARQAVELTSVTVGDSVGTAHRLVLHGAHDLAALRALSAIGLFNVIPHQAGSTVQFADVSVCNSIGTTHGVPLSGTHHLASSQLVHLCNK